MLSKGTFKKRPIELNIQSKGNNEADVSHTSKTLYLRQQDKRTMGMLTIMHSNKNGKTSKINWKIGRDFTKLLTEIKTWRI